MRQRRLPGRQGGERPTRPPRPVPAAALASAALAASIALVVAACGGSAPGQPTAHPATSQGSAASADAELLVSCAVSLGDALRDAAARFEADRPGVRVRINAGPSGLLAQQILRGAPVDLFVSASTLEIERLRAAGLLSAAPPVSLASNRLLVVVPRGAPVPPSAAALADAGYRRIAIGNPRTTPAGRYAEQWLDRSGLGDALRKRLVLAEGARQALEYVSRGEVDAGVLYRSDVRPARSPLRIAFEVPAEMHDPILYTAAILSDASQPGTARDFLDYLSSREGRLLLAHDFLPPPGS